MRPTTRDQTQGRRERRVLAPHMAGQSWCKCALILALVVTIRWQPNAEAVHPFGQARAQDRRAPAGARGASTAAMTQLNADGRIRHHTHAVILGSGAARGARARGAPPTP